MSQRETDSPTELLEGSDVTGRSRTKEERGVASRPKAESSAPENVAGGGSKWSAGFPRRQSGMKYSLVAISPAAIKLTFRAISQ
ncbi:hypothetical protein C0Q70_20682 [Pomacea canaliculata]|uniref:Uncharacterized protein n=1 Tax=Pomacea canaliculata TaxID=400727 RepID=A0A2T7NGA1_POMCA|nr:hypothetical protein C0Q70_20682 [Pomacea canaliculata]